MAMSRRPRASPWRCSGVIWASRAQTMGCTEPRAKPSSTEHKPIARADGKTGYTPNNTAVTTMAPATTACSRTCFGHQRQQPHHGRSHSKCTQDGTDDRGRQPRSCPMSGTRRSCTSQQEESTQFTMMRRRNAGSLSRSHERWGGRRQRQSRAAVLRRGAPRTRWPKAARPVRQTQRDTPRCCPQAARVVNHQPAKNGLMKLDTAGPMASQLNTWRNWVGVVRSAAPHGVAAQ